MRRQSSSDSPSRPITDRVHSASSSRLRISGTSRIRRGSGGMPRGIHSIIQQRRNIRIIENGVDVTPKPLTHSSYPPIDDKQLTVFDVFGTSRSGSTTELVAASASSYGIPRSSSTSLIRSLSIHTNAHLPLDEMMESQGFVQGGSESLRGDDIERAPSQFCLPR